MKLKTIILFLMFIVMSSITAEAQLSKTDISQLYVSIFNRASEGEGNAYWQSKADMAIVAAEMLNTDVAQNYFGASLNSNQAFIEHIYLNTLNKNFADDPTGIAYWVNELNGGKTRGEVVAVLVGVIKNYAPGGPNYNANDAATIAAYNQFMNRVEVSNYMADNVENPPSNWETLTQFSSTGLNVTYDASTVSLAQNAIDIISGKTSDLEQDILTYMNMISSVGDMSPMISEIGTVLGEVMSGDSSVVTITPPLETLDLETLPSTINIAVNFGNGYIPKESTSVFTGQAVINITNLYFSDTGISASAAMTATDIRRDGELILAGGMIFDINVGMSEIGMTVTANVNFSNLQSLDSKVNGNVIVSIPSISDDFQMIEPVTITFNQLTTQEFQVSGTVTMTAISEGFNALFDLDTNEGKVTGTVHLDNTNQDQTVISTLTDTIKVGEYAISINDVIMAPETCSEMPVSGNIIVTGASETKSIVFSDNCTYTIN